MKVWLVTGEGGNGTGAAVSLRSAKALRRVLRVERGRWARLDVSLDGTDEHRERGWSPEEVERVFRRENGVRP